MINVDEVTASRLIFAPMGVFLGKCCGNAASTSAAGARQMPDNVTARRTDTSPSGGRSAPSLLQNIQAKQSKTAAWLHCARTSSSLS